MPIFIVGFARSGTTLCQKLVSQHLGIPTLPETHYFEFLEDHEPAGGFIRPDAARELVGQLERFLQIDIAGLKPLLSRDEVPIRPLFLHLVGQQIGSQPLADKGLWIEKTPGHAEHLERIYQMFPKARFLCMVRDPVHAFASRRELQSTGRGWGEAWKPIEAFCAAWAEHVRNFRAFSERHPGQLMTIRLEDLASNPNAELVRVREFLGPGFATPIESPRHPDIIQPFETWKRDALKPADAAIADRAGKGLLDEYETWRVKTLLREPMSALGYSLDAKEPPDLDALHRRTVASLDWYVEQFARRDALMDVKTTRIRNLLNELAERNAPPAGSEPPRPVAGTLATNPLLVARVGAPARNDATARGDDATPIPGAVPIRPAGTAAAASSAERTASLGRPTEISNAAPRPASLEDDAQAPRPVEASAQPHKGAPSGALPRPGEGKGAAGTGKGAGVAEMQHKPGATGKGLEPAAVPRAPGGGGAGMGAGPSAMKRPPGSGAGLGAGAATSPRSPDGGGGGGTGGAGGVGKGADPAGRQVLSGGGTGKGADATSPPRTPGGGPGRDVEAGTPPRAGGGGKGMGAGLGTPGPGIARVGGQAAGAATGKPGLRAGLKAGARGRPGGKAGPGGTPAQRQGRNWVVDDEGALEDNLPPAWRPLTLHGISGVDDNGATFLDEAAEILKRRAAQPSTRGAGESGDDITDAGE